MWLQKNVYPKFVSRTQSSSSDSESLSSSDELRKKDSLILIELCSVSVETKKFNSILLDVFFVVID